MKRFIELTVVFTICFLFVGCSEGTNFEDNFGNLQTIIISDSTLQKASDLNSIIKKSDLIALKSDSSSFIKEVSKLFVQGNNLVVVDKKTSKIVVFDIKKKSSKTIEYVGHGPGEYVSINDASILADTLFILDLGTRKIHKYTPDGTYLSSVLLDDKYAGYSFIPSTNNYLFYRQNENFPSAKGYNLITTDKIASKLIDSASNIPNQILGMSFGSNNVLDSYNEAAYAITPFNNFIYSVNKEGKINPVYRLRYDKKYLAQNSPVWNSGIKDEYQFYPKLMNSGVIFFISNLLINSKYLIFSFNKEAVPYVCMYSKKKKKTKIYKLPSILSSNNKQLYINFIGKSDNDFYGQFIDGQTEAINKEFKQKMKMDNSEDNTLLVKITIDDDKF